MSCKVQTIILVVSFLTLLSGCLTLPPDFGSQQDIFPGASGDSWCDTDFAKRVDINVNNTAGSALTYYQVYVNLSSNPINETSLRVYNSSDCTLRQHWSENTTAGNSYALWINYSAVAASGWTNNTAIYHENATASSVGDGDATFPFFDDFNRANSDTVGNGWTEDHNIAGITSNQLNITALDETAYYESVWKQVILSGSEDIVLTTKAKLTDTAPHATAAESVYWRLYGASANQRMCFGFTGDTSTPNNIKYLNSGGWADSGYDYVPDVWNTFSIVYHPVAGNVDFWYNNIILVSGTTFHGPIATTNRTCYGVVNLENEFQYFEHIYKRKYVSLEPTTSLGSEEQKGYPTITNKQPTSPISKSSQAANFAISATISEATNNNWKINRTGSYEHLEWDNSTTTPAYTFSPQTEGLGTYKVQLTAYNTTTPSYNTSTTWDVTVSTITISSPSPGLTDTKYVSNRTLTYSAIPSTTANCSWKYQNGTLIEWDNSTTSPSTELWINSSSVIAFNISLTAYDCDYPSDYNSISWNNSIVDNVYDYTNYTFQRLNIYDFVLCEHMGNFAFGDVDNDGTNELVGLGGGAWTGYGYNNAFIIQELNGSYRQITQTAPSQYLDISIHDVEKNGTNELVVNKNVGGTPGGRVDLWQFNETDIVDSSINNVLSGVSDNPHGMAWFNISNTEQFYTAFCGGGEVAGMQIDFDGMTINKIDTMTYSGEGTLEYDIDRDGIDELIAVTGYNAGGTTIYCYELNQVTGDYDTKTQLMNNDLSAGSHWSADLSKGDIDNDGTEELIVFWHHVSGWADSSGNKIEAYEYNASYGDDMYTNAFLIDSGSDLQTMFGGHARTVVADIDGDGTNELVYGTTGTATNQHPHIYYYDIGINGSIITRHTIANFTDYFVSNHVRTVTPVWIANNEIAFAVSTTPSAGYDGHTDIITLKSNVQGTLPVISNVQNGSISSTSQYINWTVNQTAHNRAVYDKGSVTANSVACEGQWSTTHACTNASDGNWSTYAESAGALLAYAYFNYSVPTGTSQLESLYHVKDAIGHANMTIPSTCWGSTLYLRAMGSDIGNSITWQCDNGPGWTTLRSSVANVAYEQEMKFKYVSSWDNSTAAPNITLSSLTANTKYYFRARSHNTTNDSLSTNSSTFDFTTAAATNPITITDGNRALLCNWTIDTTFTNIATNLTNCTDFFAYNSTSQLWAFYSINRTINANTTISEHAAIFIHFNATTTVDCKILTAETITIPANVWYYTALRESAAHTLSEIYSSLWTDGCDVPISVPGGRKLYAWDSPAGAYTNTGSYSVLPNEGFAIYATTGCSWDGAV